ncbi:MAG: PP2C family protein-serine/threonine phosphatase [Frankiaceae bacterium]
MGDVDDDAREMLSGLLDAARFSVPDDVASLLAGQGKALGATSVIVYLVDHEQYVLVPLPHDDGPAREPATIESTMAGRCFRQLELVWSEGGRRAWVPMLDGLERLGVVELELDPTTKRVADELLHDVAALVAEIVVSKDAYGDLFARVRRRRPMSLAAEIAWRLLPPLTFGTDRVVIACVLAPAYEVGGDSFDYAVDAATAQFMVLDAMGHGLDAGLLATVAIGAYRNNRRAGLDLPEVIAAIDAALADSFGGEKFATAVLGELELASGRLRWHGAGHPAPLLLRGGRVVKALESEVGLPLGLGKVLGAARGIAEEFLEPGDRILLFTDGVVEARSPDGEFFGVERLADIATRETAAGQPAPETMRRLMHAILGHQAGILHDDATTMLVEWQGRGAGRIAPAGTHPIGHQVG